jgi:iron complex transport system substrate-binding protein
MFPPRGIICLTEETVESLYLLGEQDRIVGISGYVVRPPQARREKPRVSAFTSANIDKILGLEPDLILTFSDLQADIAADLVRCGIAVHAFNQRSVAGILDMIRMLGAMVDARERAQQLVSMLEAQLTEARTRAERLPERPKVFFEEWDDPLILEIGWVSELVEIAGGVDIFADRICQRSRHQRSVSLVALSAVPRKLGGSPSSSRSPTASTSSLIEQSTPRPGIAPPTDQPAWPP